MNAQMTEFPEELDDEIVEEKVSGEDNTEREKASEESNSDQQ